MCSLNDTVPVEIDGIRRNIDRCIAPLVSAINAAGIKTVASCCGHGRQPGSIALRDGRELLIMPNYETARMICDLFPPICTDHPLGDRGKVPINKMKGR